MKKLLMLAFAAALFFFFSCKKDDDNNTITYPDYANLKVGNYWVYQRFEIDTLGVETALDIYDSCYVEKDTLINGITYFKMIRPKRFPVGYPENYWRDSLGYIVDSTGRIRFAAEDFTTIFETECQMSWADTVYTAIHWMVDKDKVVTTPAGDFVTRTFQRKIEFDESCTQFYSPRFYNFRFTKDIGIVTETLDFFATDPNYVERRLVRYGNSMN